jgi:hypothetical protein
MKENIIDNLARGVVFAGFAWWGLRGVLGDIAEAGYLTDLLSVGALLILGFAVGPVCISCVSLCATV